MVWYFVNMTKIIKQSVVKINILIASITILFALYYAYSTYFIFDGTVNDTLEIIRLFLIVVIVDILFPIILVKYLTVLMAFFWTRDKLRVQDGGKRKYTISDFLLIDVPVTFGVLLIILSDFGNIDIALLFIVFMLAQRLRAFFYSPKSMLYEAFVSVCILIFAVPFAVLVHYGCMHVPQYVFIMDHAITNLNAQGIFSITKITYFVGWIGILFIVCRALFDIMRTTIFKPKNATNYFK